MQKRKWRLRCLAAVAPSPSLATAAWSVVRARWISPTNSPARSSASLAYAKAAKMASSACNSTFGTFPAGTRDLFTMQAYFANNFMNLVLYFSDFFRYTIRNENENRQHLQSNNRTLLGDWQHTRRVRESSRQWPRTPYSQQAIHQCDLHTIWVRR